MHTENMIIIRAPLGAIFETAADLSRWPEILPHYRWIRYLERSDERNVVTMGAKRGWIPVHWTSEQIVDRKKMEIRFYHLKAFTKGMVVIWSFNPGKDGVTVRIQHDLKPTMPLVGKFVAEVIIGGYFISFIAQQTLTHLRDYLESRHGT